MRTRALRFVAALASITVLAAIPLVAEATNAWGTYHWARTANPFTIGVVDSMTANWDGKLNIAIADWDASSVMNVVRTGSDDSSKTRKRCAAVTGMVRACNAAYGNNGWLGLAQIWLNGGHIVQGVAKMNDSYLASSSYTDTNRQHVICQELGHDWGLDHQSTTGADLNTCMDYSNALDNPKPNQHDYDELVTIYGGHFDSSTTIASLPTIPAGFANADVNAQANWGTKVSESADKRSAVFARNFGGGLTILTHVTWAP